jgi:hypothetical protein
LGSPEYVRKMINKEKISRAVPGSLTSFPSLFCIFYVNFFKHRVFEVKQSLLKEHLQIGVLTISLFLTLDSSHVENKNSNANLLIKFDKKVKRLSIGGLKILRTNKKRN